MWKLKTFSKRFLTFCEQKDPFCEQKDPFPEHSSVNKKTHFGEQKEPDLEHALRVIKPFCIGFRTVFWLFSPNLLLFSHLFLRCFHRRFSQVFSLHLRQLFAKRPPAFSVLGGVVGGGFLTSGTEGGQKDPFLHVFFDRWKLSHCFCVVFN